MNGFGFIEYEDAMDARDVVPGKSIDTIYFCPVTDHQTAFRMFL